MQLRVSRFVEGKLISCIKLSYACCHCKWGRKFHYGGALPWEGKQLATVLVWRWLVAQGRLRPAESFSHGIVSGSNPQGYSVLGVVSKFQKFTPEQLQDSAKVPEYLQGDAASAAEMSSFLQCAGPWLLLIAHRWSVQSTLRGGGGGNSNSTWLLKEDYTTSPWEGKHPAPVLVVQTCRVPIEILGQEQLSLLALFVLEPSPDIF